MSATSACPSGHNTFGIESGNVFLQTARCAIGAGTVASFDRCLLNCDRMVITGYRFLIDDEFPDQVKEDFTHREFSN
jgi:hypothetical protein